MLKKTDLSIIIVYYLNDKLLISCLNSIFSSGPKLSLEVIIVDNNEDKSLKRKLLKKFAQVKYIKNQNKGYANGNNIGARAAKGEFLLFLNPDTIVLAKSLDSLISLIRKNKEIGIVAPLLLTEKKIPHSIQGTGQLTPLSAIVSFSFFNKYFPNNPISRHYWLKDWDRKLESEVDSVIGAAFLIRKKIFQEINGFDESFFLFFEDVDLCRKVKQKGYKIIITPSIKFIHYWSVSTPKNTHISAIFQQSRFCYFRKHWGFLTAIIVESFLRSSKWLAQLS